jgi:hypothetical protein
MVELSHPISRFPSVAATATITTSIIFFSLLSAKLKMKTLEEFVEFQQKVEN